MYEELITKFCQIFLQYEAQSKIMFLHCFVLRSQQTPINLSVEHEGQ